MRMGERDKDDARNAIRDMVFDAYEHLTPDEIRDEVNYHLDRIENPDMGEPNEGGDE